uniref:Ubiquitin fusion degradaton protein n=1 Tax=Romanomermis culicivorax TaxID=13658 RepID=A0A915HKM7_ROMCU
MAMYHGQGHTSVEKNHEMENGGKIILPQTVLDYLTRLHIQYPMLFKLTNTNPASQRTTHAGVIEFHNEEGKCYMPYWMMRNLLLAEGDLILVDYSSLPTATYVKLQPQSTDFLDITNPRAVLELKLRNFACLTKSDMFNINYNNKNYEFLVEELKPANAVCILECDMNVEFSAPVGYQEPKREGKEVNKLDDHHEEEPSFTPFSGKGYRSDGKEKGTQGSSDGAGARSSRLLAQTAPKRGIPNYDYKPGKLTFIHAPIPKTSIENGSKDEDPFKAFSGAGQKLKNTKPKV